MKLAHINLTVTDTGAAADFLVRHFGLRNEGGNRGMVLLRDDDDMVIVLMKAKAVSYPETFHIGFYLDTEEKVDALRARLRDEGFAVDEPDRHHGYTFYVRAPGDFMVEVTA